MHTFDLTREHLVVSQQRDQMGELLWLKADLAAHGYPMANAVILEWCEDLVVAVERESAWVWGPIELDPAWGRDGRTVVPGEQLKELTTGAATTLPSRRLTIAHQIPLDGPVRQLLPVLRAGPRRCSEEVARALVGPPPAHPGLRRAVRTLDALVGGAAGSVAAAGRAVSAPLLDPIIFAVTAPTDLRAGEPALWIPLVAWRW
jgi:hypothetical protein